MMKIRDVTVLVHSSCCNRIPSTEGREAYNNGNLFLTVLEAVKSKVKLPTALVSAETSLPGSEGSRPSLSSSGGKDRGTLLLLVLEIEKIQTRCSIDKKTWRLHSVTIPLLCRV